MVSVEGLVPIEQHEERSTVSGMGAACEGTQSRGCCTCTMAQQYTLQLRLRTAGQHCDRLRHGDLRSRCCFIFGWLLDSRGVRGHLLGQRRHGELLHGR